MESTAPYPVKKSARVVLTVAAAMSMAARGQQAPDPCAAATFNVKACKVQHKGYCAGSTWIPAAYQQKATLQEPAVFAHFEGSRMNYWAETVRTITSGSPSWTLLELSALTQGQEAR